MSLLRHHGLNNKLGVNFSNAFITEWDTTIPGTSASNQITLPLVSTGNYNMIVYWGDGSSDEITTYNQPEITHNYSIGGVYTVSITGILEGWQFNGLGDKDKILDIKRWGIFNHGNKPDVFELCNSLNPNLSCEDVYSNLVLNTTLSGFFRGTGIQTVNNIASWDTSNITSLVNLFLNTAFNQDISGWDTSSVTSMINVFNGANFNQDISGWDTSSVTSMVGMFRNTPFNQDISGWDTSSVTNMQQMFQGATQFNQNISTWNIQNVTNLSNFLTNGGGLSTSNYDNTLIGWESQLVQNNVTFDAGNSTYTLGGSAETARTNLINDHSWSITDAGGV